MLLRNNRHQLAQRRQKQANHNDAPVRVSIRQSVCDLRKTYSDMTDKQFSKWYEKRYHVSSEEVHRILIDSNRL